MCVMGGSLWHIARRKFGLLQREILVAGKFESLTGAKGSFYMWRRRKLRNGCRGMWEREYVYAV